MNDSTLIGRLQRDTAIACGVMAAVALIWRPDQPRVAAGIVGGGVLVGLSFWAIRGAVEQALTGGKNGEIRRVSRGLVLVKFFTRHAILAVGGYVMMVRLRLDPVGMLIGVTSVVLAALGEATRRR